ncbi:MAG: hypothetical protein A2206_01360 [Candidatus Magasanikbacteria bacterium RIFOXYA1_FULL_40_8]|uniref:Uncharacterized protein n=1 Tax=Candidatus Magasanikbacteria bacterium RIFOXYA1_FULL_40_8 TaxID=1798694 RepID=A0A1F6NT43_9BACT|nr:MAG: hypothetical protein A2231_03085 [Candidatus Firestonebacteria bacterium RIFOXYA2_FULL_40_8]OGH87079.1 MAG: hypothetical protein A2206_01360 [Candidatus Magasanikbacteria bacterium RIFOXYA1_FULL_40_8]
MKNNKISQRCWNCKHSQVAGDDREGTIFYICRFTGVPTESDGLYCDGWKKNEYSGGWKKNERE